MRAHSEIDPAHNPDVKTWDYLVTDNFIAAIDMTLDVTDAGAISPNLSFIHPLPGGSTLNRTLSLVGQYNRTRDDSVQLQYVVDLTVLRSQFDHEKEDHDQAVAKRAAKVPNLPCVAEQMREPADYLGGNLRLHDVLADGLASLEATSEVSLYGTSGPTKAIMDATNEIAKVRKAPNTTTKDLAEKVSAVITGQGLNQILENLAKDVSVTESDKAAVSELTTNVNDAEQALQQQQNLPAIRSDPVTSTSIQKALVDTKQFKAAVQKVADKTKAPKTSGGSGGAAQGIVGSTSFQSTINFAVTYGASGGPNWTLVHFKGPGGGSGGGGAAGSNLLGYNRTHTDNLKITFSPTCRDGEVNPSPKNFWEAVPVCTGDGSEQKRAVAAGAQTNNVLSGLTSIQTRR